MDYRIVPRQADDADRCYRLYKAAEPLEWDYDRLFARHSEEHGRLFDVRASWLIEHGNGQLAAAASACLSPERPHEADIEIAVHPASIYDCRPWLGEAYEIAMDWARDHGATLFSAWSSDREPWRIEFFAARGYRIASRESCSVLDLTQWDPMPLMGKARRADEAGVEILSMLDPGAPEPDQVPDLVNRAEESMPSATGWVAAGAKRVLHRIFESPHHDPSLLFWARLHGEWAGLSMILPWSPESAMQDDTAVFEPFRGKGIAWALKLPITRAAQQRGIKRLITWNEVGNAGMLAVNRQMGYVHRMHEMQMLLGYDGPSE